MPKLLDLFCGCGGCSVGYARAGWDVTGVDHVFHEAYPDGSHGLFSDGLDVSCTFILADAMELVRDIGFLDQFQAVAASPPCPAYSQLTSPSARHRHPRLIGPVREALEAWGRGPYLIENVEGAAADMPGAVRLCGSSFGLAVRRHRLFQSNLPITAPDCDHASQGVAIGVYGDHPDPIYTRNGVGKGRMGGGQKARSLAEGQAAMGITWMGWDDLADAIPPAYTQHLGAQLLAAIGTP